MTSIYGADPVYYPEGPSVSLEYAYQRGSVMHYLYHNCPVFALCAQKAGNDRWLDAENFHSTCFVPSNMYSKRNLPRFRNVDITTARDLVHTSIIQGKVDVAHLMGQEFLPTWKQSYLKVAPVQALIFLVCYHSYWSENKKTSLMRKKQMVNQTSASIYFF